MLLLSDFARSVLKKVDREVRDICVQPVEHPIALISGLNPKSYIRCRNMLTVRRQLHKRGPRCVLPALSICAIIGQILDPLIT
jgi:hypothetical protein